MSTISASTTSTTAYKVTADTTGTLVLQTGASPTTAMTIDGSQNVTLAGNITLNNGTADGAQLSLSSAGYSDWNIDNYSGNFRWYYNATEYMRLSNSGNLGLGVTPSAWYGNMKAVQFSDTASYISSYTSGITTYQHMFLGNNGYMDASGNWIYSKSRPAAQYYQQDNTHKWLIAASGTAGNAISFTQAMTLDASGRLGLGTTGPIQKLELRTDTTTNGSEANIFLNNRVFGTTAYYSGGVFAGGYRDTSDPTYIAGIDFLRTSSFSGYASAGSIIFYTDTAGQNSLPNLRANSERARIDSSGNLLVGTTSLLSTARGSFHAVVNGNAAEFKVATNGYGLVFYSAANAFVGSIAINSASVSFNTTSDYRLKENIKPMTGALAKVAQLKPCTYNWKADGSDGEGFIAHELAEVVPQCVTGAKDAVDEEGNPVYQGIDTSFLVATLTAAIQEQQAIIETLTNRITALEAK